MSLPYCVIEIFTSEEARCKNLPLYEAIIRLVRGKKIAGRCVVYKGTDACYENGELATHNLLALSFNMPVKIEILLPSPETDTILQELEEMVAEGIIAIRELSIHCHKTRKHLIPRQIRVSDIMTGSPETVFPSTPVSKVAKLLLSATFTGVPVVDSKNRTVGIVTQGDLIYRANMPLRIGLLNMSDRSCVEKIFESMAEIKTEEVMSSPAVTAFSDMFVTEAVSLMLEKTVKRLPVVDKNGVLTGILSRLDIFRTITKESPDWSRLNSRNIVVGNLRFVSDIMRRDTQTVLPEASAEDVIRIIDSDDIQRVAVVDSSNRFMGLISDKHLLSAFSVDQSGIWDYLSGLVSFSEKGRRHKQLQKKLREKTAADIMETDLITVGEETGIDEAIKIMTEKGLKRLPVLDEERRYKGMISREALLHTGFDCL